MITRPKMSPKEWKVTSERRPFDGFEKSFRFSNPRYVRGRAYRFGGQHGHPPAVNILADNNLQCQSSPEVAHSETLVRARGGRWSLAAPMPWPASHVGLSTVAVGDDVLVVSGKDGKEATARVAAYDAVADRWRELRRMDWGQPDFLAYVERGRETGGLHNVTFGLERLAIVRFKESIHTSRT